MTDEITNKDILEKLDTLVTVVCKDVAKHDQTLYGNGQEGLTTTVKVLQSNHKNFMKIIADTQKRTYFIVGTVLTVFGIVLAIVEMVTK